MVLLFLKLNLKVTTLGQQLRRVDWIGMILFIGSTTGLLIPLTWGGVMYSWNAWRTLVPLLVSAAGLVGFIVWEERFAADPLIRTRVLKNRSAAVTYFGDFIQGLILWCGLYCEPANMNHTICYCLPYIRYALILPSSQRSVSNKIRR